MLHEYRPWLTPGFSPDRRLGDDRNDAAAGPVFVFRNRWGRFGTLCTAFCLQEMTGRVDGAERLNEVE